MSGLLPALALLLAMAGGAAGAGGGGYCAAADVAWRALEAPLALEARVVALSAEAGGAATVRVRRVLRRAEGRWPRADRTLRLLADARARSCAGRHEARLRVGGSYIVFAERRGRAAAALGPPLRRTEKLLRRIRAVYAKNYVRPAKVEPMASMEATAGSRVRIECRASGRPPPRITWYKDDKPVEQIALRRLRVQSYRRRSVLEIRRARRTDSARYECRARGAVGEPARAAAALAVRARRPAPAPAPSTPAPDSSTLGLPCPMPDPSSFCMNGGTCLYFQQVRESACRCPEGFFGHRCENKDVSNQSINNEDDWD